MYGGMGQEQSFMYVECLRSLICQKLGKAIYKACLKEFNGFRDVSYIPYKIKEPSNKLNIKLGMPPRQLVK